MNIYKMGFALLLICATFLAACKKVEPETSSAVTAHKQSPVSLDAVTYNYTSEYAYNLNVIYFVASDRDTNANYNERLSKIMLNYQSFVADWMQRWGYERKTFGILKDSANSRVKILLVRGSKTMSNYNYDDLGTTHANAQADINAWFTAHPGEKTSEHNLIIFAVNEKLDQCQEQVPGANAPFYGIGRNCYALDFPGMSIDKIGTTNCSGDDRHRGWIAGMFHELGHGLNLPHCGELVSETNSPQYGTSLMGAGNYSYLITPTYLTHSSCAILNNCQVFSKVQKTFYGTVTAKIETLQASYTNGNINVSGTFSSSVPVTDVTYYHRPTNDDGGYTAVTWVSKPAGNSFSISMPVAEFQQKGNQAYEFSIILNQDDGNNSSFKYSYTFQNNIPIIAFSDKNDYAKTSWSVAAFSSQETSGEGTDGRAAQIIDNNTSTYWHSRWTSSATSYPHYITVNMGAALPAKGFSFYQRDGQRKIKNIEILVSNNNNSWTNLGSYVLANSVGRQNIDLPQSRTFRYFKVKMNSGWDGSQYAALAEVAVYN